MIGHTHFIEYQQIQRLYQQDQVLKNELSLSWV